MARALKQRLPRGCAPADHYAGRMSTSPPGTGARQFRIAAWLQIVQGVLMEGVPFLGLLVLLAFGVDQSVVTENADIFALPFLQDNLYPMMAMSGIFAALRITSAIGLLRNRMWGLALSLINCTVTLALMIFILPAGILDGLLSGSSLILILIAWFGTTPIGERRRP